jgi:RND family efflux transporter MFP subunit
MRFALWGCLLAGSSAMIAGCRSADSALPAATQTLQARVVQSQQLELPVQLRATGTVHAKEMAVVSAQVIGRIKQVLVREGDLVHAGQTLVVLDDSALRASLEQSQADVVAAQHAQAAAQANSALAASTLARYKQLESQRSVSLQEIDEVSRRAEEATANLDAQRALADSARARESGAHVMLAYTRLIAPFSGVVTSRMADPGTMAGPGVPLLQIDHAGPLQLQVGVDESVIGGIHRGMQVPVSIAGSSGGEIAGTVADVLPAADVTSHSFQVKIDLPSSISLHVGMYGSAAFGNGVRQAILVPRSAIVARGSLSCVYALDAQGVAQLRYVTVGSQQGNLVEVLSGVASAEKLVDAPSDRELAGKRIVDSENGAKR